MYPTISLLNNKINELKQKEYTLTGVREEAIKNLVSLTGELDYTRSQREELESNLKSLYEAERQGSMSIQAGSSPVSSDCAITQNRDNKNCNTKP